jgi:hypothetical protein
MPEYADIEYPHTKLCGLDYIDMIMDEYKKYPFANSPPMLAYWGEYGYFEIVHMHMYGCGWCDKPTSACADCGDSGRGEWFCDDCNWCSIATALAAAEKYPELRDDVHVMHLRDYE